MRRQRYRDSLIFALALGTAGCHDGTAPLTTLAIPTAPDFVAVVTRSTLHEFFAPAGFWVSQYEVWVAIAPSQAANAGVVVGASQPVFVSTGGVLAQVTPAEITPGDTIQVWREASVGYGSVQAPPGAPSYFATQIVIIRSGP